MTWLIVAGFAISSSLDNLGVGISYGIRKIHIGFVSNLIIAVICFLFSEIGILGGQWLSRVLPGIFPALVGAFLLFIIGIRIMLLSVPRKQQKADLEKETSALSVKGILQNPERANTNKSGDIGYGESILLGVALSANAVTNGVGAGLLGLSPLAISLTASIGSFVTVWVGVAVGKRAAGIRIGSFSLGQFGTLLSGVILIFIAINAIF